MLKRVRAVARKRSAGASRRDKEGKQRMGYLERDEGRRVLSDGHHGAARPFRDSMPLIRDLRQAA